MSEYATKEDLAHLEILLREEIHSAEQRVQANIVDTERQLRGEALANYQMIDKHLDTQDSQLRKITWFIIGTLLAAIGALIDVVIGNPVARW